MAETTSTASKNNLVAKVLPVLLPLAAIAIVAFLGYRWYSLQTNKNIESPEISPKVEIESLDPAEQTKLQNMARGIGDYKTTKLNAVKSGVGAAEVRFEVKDGKFYASVVTNLTAPADKETYQVWLKVSGANDWQESAILAENKAGYMSTFVLPEDKLPVEVKITHEGIVGQDPAQEIVLFQGLVSNK